MSSYAPGQLLGYTMQFPRALSRLLQVGPGGKVGVEIVGDVSSHFSNGTVISEEDKSSIIKNPLTDRSTDLWKTFYNWINAINAKEIDLEKTVFVLYCNKPGRKGLVNQFNDVKSIEDAKKSIISTKKELENINNKHEIWTFYDFVINKNEELFQQIIQKFEFQLGKDAAFDDLKVEFQRLSLPDNLIEHAMNEISGWFQKTIIEKIASKKLSVISWEEYNKYAQPAFTRIRNKELIDFASKQLPSKKDITKVINVQPAYICQLDFISLPSNEVIEAVSDYMRADINRNAWIEKGILDECSANDFENRLFSYWENAQNEISITQSKLSEKKQGKLLLYRCKSRQEKINNITPPDRTISGTYHAIADRKEIGWHPLWENLINEKGDSHGTNS